MVSIQGRVHVALELLRYEAEHPMSPAAPELGGDPESQAKRLRTAQDRTKWNLALPHWWQCLAAASLVAVPRFWHCLKSCVAYAVRMHVCACMHGCTEEEEADAWKALKSQDMMPVRDFLDRDWQGEGAGSLCPLRLATICSAITELASGYMTDLGLETVMYKQKPGSSSEISDYDAPKGSLSTHSCAFDQQEFDEWRMAEDRTKRHEPGTLALCTVAVPRFWHCLKSNLVLCMRGCCWLHRGEGGGDGEGGW